MPRIHLVLLHQIRGAMYCGVVLDQYLVLSPPGQMHNQTLRQFDFLHKITNRSPHRGMASRHTDDVTIFLRSATVRR